MFSIRTLGFLRPDEPPPITIIQDISSLINTFSCSFSIKSVQKEGEG